MRKIKCLQCELFMLFKKNSARHKLNLFQLISNYYEFDPTDAIFKNIRQKSMFFLRNFAQYSALFRITRNKICAYLRNLLKNQNCAKLFAHKATFCAKTTSLCENLSLRKNHNFIFMNLHHNI